MPTIDTPKTLYLKKFGNSFGLILPIEVLTAMGAKRQEGEPIVLRRCPTSGRLEISAEDSEFARKLEVLREIMEEDDDVFTELAR